MDPLHARVGVNCQFCQSLQNWQFVTRARVDLATLEELDQSDPIFYPRARGSGGRENGKFLPHVIFLPFCILPARAWIWLSHLACDDVTR